MQVAYLNVQCTERSGEIGDFLTAVKGAADRTAISPVFTDLAETFDWMRDNGWMRDEYPPTDQFDPWRCSHP